MSYTAIDVHCHYFNGEYAVSELMEICNSWLLGNYPNTFSRGGIKPGETPSLPDLSGLHTYIASLFSAAVRDPAEHYLYEQERFEKSLWSPVSDLITVPLMMDIFFALDDGSSSSLQSASLEDREKGTAQPFKAFFEEQAGALKSGILEAFTERGKGWKRSTAVNEDGEVEHRIDQAIDEFLDREETLQPAVSKGLPETVRMTKGYEEHLKALEHLQEMNPGTVLPFLAVDPRRKGVETLVRTKVLSGGFKGVKLYPPLGYYPAHPALYPVYELCVDNTVPVTVHAMPYAFNSMCRRIQTQIRRKDGSIENITVEFGVNEKPSYRFAQPKQWLEILENPRFSKLRLNFAHFGGEHIERNAGDPDDSENWTSQIIELMKRFEHVYADFSASAQPEAIRWIQTIAQREPVVKERLMFGSDYLMVMLNDRIDGDLVNYFNHFAGIEPEMRYINAAKFLDMHAG